MLSRWLAAIQLQFFLCARRQKPVSSTIGVNDIYGMIREEAVGELRWCEFLMTQRIFAIPGLYTVSTYS